MKIVAVLFFTLYFVCSVKSQDAVFLNSNQSLTTLNPSFAGSNGGIRYQSAFRKQWPNLSGTYVTFQNNFDAYIKPIRGGVFVGYMRDDQANGILITDKFDIGYAQYLSFYEGNLKIIPSFQASYMQLNIDKSKLTFGDMIDARRGFVWYSNQEIVTYKTAIDLSSGLLVNYKHFYIGGSYFHITQPDVGLADTYRLPSRLCLFTSYNLL